MCQHDPLIVDEYKNPLVELSRNFLFQENNSMTDSIFIQLLVTWTCVLNDAKNLPCIHIPFMYALNTIKTIFLSSGKL